MLWPWTWNDCATWCVQDIQCSLQIWCAHPPWWVSVHWHVLGTHCSSTLMLWHWPCNYCSACCAQGYSLPVQCTHHLWGVDMHWDIFVTHCPFTLMLWLWPWNCATYCVQDTRYRLQFPYPIYTSPIRYPSGFNCLGMSWHIFRNQSHPTLMLWPWPWNLCRLLWPSALGLGAVTLTLTLLYNFLPFCRQIVTPSARPVHPLSVF